MELERDLMTKEEVLYQLGDISEDTFYRLCYGGSLERVYPRRNIMRITRESYLAYLETVKKQTTQPQKGAAYGSAKRKSIKSSEDMERRELGAQSSQGIASKIKALFNFKD
jgi:hypothetical protein